jgi:non-ribosomal peptide synthetase component F/aryl carrier-like protein
MQIDSLGVTPSMLAMLSPSDIPACLKQVTTVGEPVSASVLSAWVDKVEFKVSYGLSECAQLNFSRRLTKGDNPALVGKPSDTTQAYILLPDTNEVADIGEAGELCLVGPQLSDGYLNRPIETAKAFVPNPFGYGRMFRTGDLAVEHEDGRLEILGRIDFQIKLNGQRVEPEEVSSALKNHMAVLASTVIAANVGENKSLVAAIVTKPEEDWDSLVGELRLKAQELLPPFMVPSYWLKYDALPTNANGKVDIRQIQYRAQNTPVDQMISRVKSVEVVADLITDAVERSIQLAWADILSLEPHMIGRHDSFLALGGDSMQAIRMVNNLRTLGIDLGLDALFRHEDLAALSAGAAVHDVSSAPAEMSIIPFSMISDESVGKTLQTDRGVVDAYPTTPLQESLVGLTLQGSNDYLYQRVWDVKSLDLIRLKLAFHIAFLKSETLRTTFDWTDSGLMQIVRNDLPFQWQMLDMSLEEYKKRDQSAGVSLGSPFFRVAVLNGSALVVSMHHALFDFWSSTFIYEDVAALYQGLEPSPRPLFKSFVKKLLETDSKEAEVFWESYLGSAQTTVLNNAPSSKTVSIKRSSNSPLDQISATCGVTSSTILNFAWAVILSRHLDSNDVTLANTLSGREIFVEGVDRLDGPTLTVIPRRFQLDPSMTLQNLMSTAHHESFQVLKHSQFGMRNALKAAGQSAGLFDTMINILPPSNSRGQQVSAEVFKRLGEKPTWQTEYTTLEIELERSQTHFTLTTSMEEKRAEFILDQLVQFISNIAHDPSATLKSLSVITMSEVEMLDTPKQYPSALPQFLHEEFENHARRTPWRVALQWQNEEVLTYRMLDQRANRVARHLQKQGLKRGDFACLLLEKSPMMIVSILAVLKTGAAYIPLAPDNPIDRNSFIVSEAGAKVILTERPIAQAALHRDVEVIYVDELNVSKLSHAPINTKISGDDIAYVIFTSGSTGMPKGCVINHSAAAAGIESMIKAEGRREGEWRALQFSNYTFDASVLDIFNTLNSGGTVCMAPTDRLMSDLSGVIDEMNVTHSFMTPTVARLISPDEAPSLKTASVGGEPLSDDVLRNMADRRVIQCYGPTETAMVITMRDMSVGENPRNLGKPFDTVQVFIVERDGTSLVPYGAVSPVSPHEIRPSTDRQTDW